MQSLNQVLDRVCYNNVNNVKNKVTNNVINVKIANNNKKINSNNLTEVRARANTLADKLNDHKSINFYYKICWYLPENVIWRNLEQAQGGNNPRAYFTFLCKLEMGK